MKYTVLKFSAEWCGPCKAMTPIFDKVKNEFSSEEIEFNEIDIEEDINATEEFKIMSVPTFVILKDGAIVGKKTGSMPEENFRDFIKQNLI